MAEPLSGEAEHALGFFEIEPKSAHESLDRYRLVDVREPHEYTGPLSHIDGSELVPLRGLMDNAGSWEKSQPILLICRSGRRSARAAEALMDQGFEHCTNLLGGMIRWNEDQLPTA